MATVNLPIELDGTPPADAFGSGTVTFIGTATVLLRYGGFTILTDPNFLHAGQRAYLGLGLSSRRLTDPALRPEDLPPLDFVVLSHHHGDHFDRVAADSLDKTLPIITEPHSARKLHRQRFAQARALQTWQTQTVTRGDATVRVTAMPGKHAPQPLQALIPRVMGSMLEFQLRETTVLRLYITGDTLLHDRLREIPARYPDIDLALVHLGGTRIAGVLLTMDGRQGVEALRIVRPAAAIPVHYDDYTVFKSPLEDFRQEVGRTGLGTEITYLQRGESHRFEVEPARLAGGAR